MKPKELQMWMVTRSPNRTQNLGKNLSTVMMFVEAASKAKAVKQAMADDDFGFGEERSSTSGIRVVMDYCKPVAKLVAPGKPFFV